MTYKDFNELFPTEEKAIEYFINVRYKGLLTCPHCGTIDQVYRYKGNLKLVQCHTCNNSFSPFTGTIFYKTHADMRDWFYAIHLLLNDKKGVSGCNLERELGVCYKTAHRMERRIREAMGNVNASMGFEGFVEIDETYIGGKPRKQNALVKPDGTKIPRKYPKKSKRGRGTNKTPVVGILERKSGRVHLQVAVPNEKGKKLSGEQLLGIIEKACKEGTVVITDDFKAYNILDKDNKFSHLSVNHSKGEYCNFLDKKIHTNGIENFWSIVKKAYYGTHHHYSKKYMQNYLDECSFRYYHRKNDSIVVFNTVLEQAVGA